MKYFTANLLARYRSTDDDVAQLASAEWETACVNYRKSLASLRPLPPAIRWIANHYNHDAKIVSFKLAKRLISIVMVPEDGKKIELRYTLTRPPQHIPHSLPELANDGPIWSWWLYDEIRRKGEKSWSHSILFTGGRELRLQFSRVEMVEWEMVAEPFAAPQIVPFGELDKTLAMVG